MRTAIEQLPDDIETLKRLIIERDALVEAKRLEVVEARLADREAQAADRALQAHPVGAQIRASRRAVAQLELIVESFEANLPPGEEPAPAPPQADDAPAKDKPARRPLPDHLPRTTPRTRPGLRVSCVWHGAQAHGRRRIEYSGVRSRALQGDPDGAAQDELPQVLDGGVQAPHAESADPQGYRRTRAAGTRGGEQVPRTICRCTGNRRSTPARA